MVFCNHCGEENPNNSGFCSSCGRPLKKRSKSNIIGDTVERPTVEIDAKFDKEKITKKYDYYFMQDVLFLREISHFNLTGRNRKLSIIL